jgi:uncharacterized LabA/DUF88 family protein
MRSTLPVADVVTYIDGFNLYNGLRSAFGRRFLWLDLEALATRLLRPGQELRSVRYFTAAVRNDQPALRRQQRYWNALSAATSAEILVGRFQEKHVTCRSCGNTWRSYEEKETDVSIAVALVEDAALARFDVAVVISADSDLVPAIRSIRRLRPQARCIVVFPPNRRSDDLRRNADAAFTLGRAVLRDCLLPERVPTPGGEVIVRPPSWR